MIHRDKITLHCRRAGQAVDQVVYGTVVTEQAAGELSPLSASLVFANFYRLTFPASLDLTGATDITVSWGTRKKVRLDTAITPHYIRGRVHHFEAVVKAS